MFSLHVIIGLRKFRQLETLLEDLYCKELCVSFYKSPCIKYNRYIDKTD